MNPRITILIDLDKGYPIPETYGILMLEFS